MSGGTHLSPRPIKSRPDLVAPPQRVSPAERNDLPVVESHPPEHFPQVLCALGGVGETTVGRDGLGGVAATEGEGDGGTAGELDCDGSGHSPDV